MARRVVYGLGVALSVCVLLGLAAGQEASTITPLAESQGTTSLSAGAQSRATTTVTQTGAAEQPTGEHVQAPVDYWSMLFVFVLATFIGLGVIARVSRLLHTPLMSITNAISAIAVVGSIIVTGSDYPRDIRILGAIALFASMTNIVSGFLITDRMLKMFKQPGERGKR
jgi:H+-translocating NAD(P) transhydrogenase subunit alpha